MNNIERKLKKIWIAASAFFVVGIVMAIMTSCLGNDDQNDTNAVREKAVSIVKKNRPMIIWFHDLEKDPEILRLAISSGIFSHVMLEGVNQLDRPNYYTVPKFRKALEVLRKHKDVKIIWCRWLYPGHKLDSFRFEDAFDAQYYVRQIRQIRKEAKLMAVDLVAFDTEPYVKCPLLAIPSRRIAEAEFNVIRDAIRTAVKAEGQVDFVLPAPFIFPGPVKHLYAATSEIGENVIAEHTYLDVPQKREDKRRPYDIFGASVRITKENKEHPEHPRFTPREILKRQDLWAHKKGLFIYPGTTKNDVTATALEFSKIRAIPAAPKSDGLR